NGAEVRSRIGEAACNAARSVDYTGAGTVEFLVSDDAPDQFFFMEMNTRLQVEHPVTEMVTGIDLVEWQVRIAAGAELTLQQADVELSGHAVEARVYAEVPEKNFLPSTGTVLQLDELPPNPDGRVRVDSSLVEGLELSAHYDPMISKMVAWGADRGAALASLDAALAGYTALGIETNVEYLRLLLNDPDVRAGRLDTGLIERKLPALEFRRIGEPELVAAALYALSLEAQNDPAPDAGPWQGRSGWRLGAPAPRRISLGTPDGGVASVLVSGSPNGGQTATVTVDGGATRSAALHWSSRQSIDLDLDGERRSYRLAPVFTGPVEPTWSNPLPGRPAQLFLGNGGWSCRLDVLTREARLERVLAAVQRQEGAADPEVRSPMPGTVVAVPVYDGAEVEAGEVLVSVEAMKMEHHLVAPQAGTVHLAARTGDLVKADQVLATVHPHPAAAEADSTDAETATDEDQGEGA
ncbi:MAG: biotin/lipoyl-containing protein, partial [Arthrobacter sp.]